MLLSAKNSKKNSSFDTKWTDPFVLFNKLINFATHK